MADESSCGALSTASSLDIADSTSTKDGVMLLDEVDLDDSFLEDCFVSYWQMSAQQQELNDPLIRSDASLMSVEGAQSTCSVNSIESTSTHSDAEQQQCDRPNKISSSDKFFSEEYSRALKNLASSMRRSELTRSKILRQRKQDQSSRWRNTQGQQMLPMQQRSHPSPQTILGLSSLLSGRSSTLTLGLEQSRRQLKSYTESVHGHSL